MERWYKLPLIISGALVVTALGIDAADTFEGSRFTLMASLIKRTGDSAVCVPGTVPVWLESGTLCVDQFEASAAPGCVYREPPSIAYTQDNMNNTNCAPESIAGALPWRYVTRTQAEQLCARVGKQLITPTVWYQSALGTDETKCNTNAELAATGVYTECVSGVGVYDMVGNVWEWVQGDVATGIFDGRALPASGYVSLVDSKGIALETLAQGTSSYAYDYLWSAATGTTALMRGGFYGGQSDAGLYSVHAGVRSDFASAAVGFRCMQPLLPV